jgi:hypothetical protein
LRQATLFDPQHEVVMGSHQGVGQDPPVVLLGDPIHHPQEEQAVTIGQEDALLVVAARADVVNAFRLITQAMSHVPTVNDGDRPYLQASRIRDEFVALTRGWLPPDMAGSAFA